MPKTSNNSRPCTCCGRLMPRKTGKRKTCSTKCTTAFQRTLQHQAKAVRREKRRAGRLATNSGPLANKSRAMVGTDERGQEIPQRNHLGH